jgi:23S rRNA pseudouridine1911/1915/1917 synthase
VTNIGRHPVNRQKMAVVAAPAGKEAVTDYRVLRCDPHGGWAVLQCVIHTGRTHQIRVHLKEVLRRPILGDTIYAQVSRQKTKVERLMLHARGLGFRHPVSGEFLRFEAPMPEAFRRFV